MSYRMRIIMALLVSVALNGWIWSKSGMLFERKPVEKARTVEQEDMLLVRLAPPPEPENGPKSLINTLDHGQEQPQETDRISEFDSIASDNQSSEDQDGTPIGTPDEDMEVMPDAVNPVPPAPPQQEITPSPKLEPVEEVVEEKEAEQTLEKPEEQKTKDPIIEAKKMDEGFGKEKEMLERIEEILEEAPTPKEEEPKEEEESKEEQERIEVAKSEEVPQLDPALPQTPVEGEKNSPLISSGKGVEGKGFLNFDANSHEMAPYMKEIQKKVRTYWLAGVQMRYPGSTRAKAKIKCSIRPNGTLESVEVINAGNSVTFSLICSQAIQRAAPFPEFPFDVPKIYRNENLEITWTFSYL